jgi:hypothetical protein
MGCEAYTLAAAGLAKAVDAFFAEKMPFQPRFQREKGRESIFRAYTLLSK